MQTAEERYDVVIREATEAIARTRELCKRLDQTFEEFYSPVSRFTTLEYRKLDSGPAFQSPPH